MGSNAGCKAASVPKCVRELANNQILAAIKKLDLTECERVTNRVCVYKSLCREE